MDVIWKRDDGSVINYPDCRNKCNQHPIKTAKLIVNGAKRSNNDGPQEQSSK